MKNTLILLFIILLYSCQGGNWGEIRYTHSKTNVRTYKSSLSEIVTTLESNQKLKVVVSEYDWWLVYDFDEIKKTRRNALGYVHKSLLYSTPAQQNTALTKQQKTNPSALQLKHSTGNRRTFMNINFELVIGILSLIIVIVLFWAIKSTSKKKYYEKKYSKIINIDEEVEKSIKEKQVVEKDIEKLRTSYKDKKIIFNNLVKEAAIYDETIEMAELGFYKPHFDFDTSEEYKEQIISVKSEQKQMIKDKEAIYCNIEWTVENSKVKGRTMINRTIRLTARAFNNECGTAIINTRWNNAVRMEQRIEKVFGAINKLNASYMIEISDEYLELKLKELRLTHEYKEKKQEEKEEQAERRRRDREEDKLKQDMEKAIKEEDKYQKLLEKAKADAEKVTGARLESLMDKIASLDKELTEAKVKSERAKSMAEQTKIGHVYIISNIGSFGEDVYKIGLTRRLEPLDRVRELGDASVPFLFDVHAMIYAEDAFALEKALHKTFDFKRLNLVNSRKEFFRTTLNEIKDETLKISPNAEFIETAEARQYRESQALRAQREEQNLKTSALEEFPDSI